MKFVSAITALVAALAVGSEAAKTKNRNVSNRELNQRMKNGHFDKSTIMKNAKPHSEEAKRRALDSLELTGGYSIQFNSCFSLTTSYDDIFDDDEDGTSMMSLMSAGNIMPIQSYAIFRICYGSNCNANGNEALLEYVVDLKTYVMALVNYLPEQMEGFCEACQENYDSCMAILYGQYGQNYNANNENAYKYQQYNANDNNYNGNNVNNVNYSNGQYGYYGNGGNRKLAEFQQRVLEDGQVVRQLDCQLCEEYSCLDDDDQNDLYGFEAASEWLEEIAECKETGIPYQGGYNNNQYGGQYYQNNNQNNNDAQELYAGVICNGDGSGIELALFYDEECALYLPNEAYTNYMSYFEQTYQQMTKEIVEFTFSDAIFSCKNTEVVYTTQDLSQYGGNYQQNNYNNNDDDDIAEWCETLVGGEISDPVDMSSCGMYDYYSGNGNGNYYDGGSSYQERYDQYQNQDENNQYMYQYDWYRYEISEDDSLDMMEVCKLAKQSGGNLHTYFNTNNGNMYSYTGSGTTDAIEEYLDAADASSMRSGLSGGAKFSIVALVGITLGAAVALFLRFKSSTIDDKNVGLIDPDEAEPKGEVA